MSASPGDRFCPARPAAATKRKTERPRITRISADKNTHGTERRIRGSVLVLSCLFAFFVDILFPSVASRSGKLRTRMSTKDTKTHETRLAVSSRHAKKLAVA